MPKLDNLHLVEKGLKIGTYKHPTDSKEPVWYARMYWATEKTEKGVKGGINKILSTKIPYERGSKYAKQEAIEVASDMFNDFKRKIDVGVSPLETITLKGVAKEYIDDISKQAQANERAIAKGDLPRWEVDGGKGHWINSRVDDEISHIKVLREYFKKIPEDITTIQERHLDTFKEWGQKPPRKWSPSTINRYIVTIRHIFRYAKKMGYVNYLPSPKRAREELKARSRRDLKIDEYKIITKYLREKYTNPEKWVRTSGVGDKMYRKTLAYQFHNWVLLIANSGIRPPNGNVEKNLIKWEHIIDEKGRFPTKKSKQYMMKRDEKGHIYKAVIRPTAYQYILNQKELQKKHGVKSEYVFAHCFTKEGQFEKGEPIKSFKKQWLTMMNHLELNPKGKGHPASERLAPYSLRGFYMTARLIDNKEIRIQDLAQSTGTSVRMLEQTYYDFDTSKVYDELTSSKLDRSKLTPQYDTDGYYIGRA